jgi:hypothetical protein
MDHWRNDCLQGRSVQSDHDRRIFGRIWWQRAPITLRGAVFAVADGQDGCAAGGLPGSNLIAEPAVACWAARVPVRGHPHALAGPSGHCPGPPRGFCVKARRFRCLFPDCAKVTFAEQVDGLTS